jgi:hypothetical protein
MDDMGVHYRADADMQQYEPNVMSMVSMPNNEHAACCCGMMLAHGFGDVHLAIGMTRCSRSVCEHIMRT